MEVKSHINNAHATAKRWLQPLNRGGHIKVSNTTVYEKKIGTLESGRLMEGGRVIGGRLIKVRL